MEIEIRHVRPGDEDILTTVADDVFDEDISPNLLSAYLRDSRHLLCVALDRGCVVGQARAVIHLNPDRGADLYIDNVGVAPSYKRRGVATRLMAELQRLGRARGCGDLWLGTESDNEEAIAFYRAIGLKESQMALFEKKLTGETT